MTALTLIMTTAGLGRFTAAQVEDDIDLTVAEVAFTDQVFAAAPTLTALPGEFRRMSTISGAAVGDNIVHMIVRDDEAITYQVRGFGLFLADGTLFAVYGQSDVLLEKSSLSSTLLALDIAFPTSDIDELTFGDTNWLNPPATTTTKGVAMIAKPEAIDAGTDEGSFVPPSGLRHLIPLGFVALWFGTANEAPSGWAICDGRTVTRSDGIGTITTPDLRDRVAVGAGGAHALGDVFGASSKESNTTAAGAHTPTGTLPAHSHGLTNAGAANAKTGETLTTVNKTEVAGGGSGIALQSAVLNDPGHTHTLTGNTDAIGPLALQIDPVPAHQHTVTIDVTQPSIALHYIMRI